MQKQNDTAKESFWPGHGVLLLAAAVVVAGYGVSLVRGPSPAEAVGILVFAAPEPAAELAPEPGS